ncbi:MAG TPA: tetratricopeptide repeat protein [Pyrinomonadaceae bacterium]|nr:tetratricopeptide repeat protein [Pyrinomonadaceae bacterium]
MKIFAVLILFASLTFPSIALPQSREPWRSVRTNNLFVIGNADADSLQQVAAWLEFFHSAFSRLTSRSSIDSSVPTTVIVFRDEASFTPFKPLYQGKPANVSGYFQPGEDANYIVISLEGSGRDRFATAFHEYVHLHLRNTVPGAPLWLNEGLAEFYGALQFSGGEALIGAPIPAYLQLLRSQPMLPLGQLFSIGTNSPHYNERDKAGIFYGESWALVHFLMLRDGLSHQDQFSRFLQSLSRGDDAERAFEDSFSMTLSNAEQQLRDYIRSGELKSQRLDIGDSQQSYSSFMAMQRSSLLDGEVSYYLGDLLSHMGRIEDAERYFLQAISQQPDFIPPYAALGLLRIRQQRYDEAKKYLQKACSSQQSYLIHYLYAYVLSREGFGPNGEFTSYTKDSVNTIRDQLQTAIKLNPQFAPAYHLLALIDFVTDERLDQAVLMAEKAHQLDPSRSSFSMLLAQIYLRQSNTVAARQVLESLTRDSNENVRAQAEGLIARLKESSGNRVKLSQSVLAEPVQPASRGIVTGATSTGAARDGQTIDQSGPMPGVDEVLTRYVQALGGADAIKSVTSRVTKGTLDVIGASRNGSFEIYSLAPNKTLTILQTSSLGIIKMGFNGQSGWVQTPGRIRQLKGAELASLQLDSDFHSPIRIRSNYSKANLLGKSKIGYREVYVLELQPAGGAAEKLYLDAESYLPVRLNAIRINGAQLMPVEVYFDEWQKVDGINIPFTITESFPRLTLVFKATEIKHRVAIDGKLFDSPAR